MAMCESYCSSNLASAFVGRWFAWPEGMLASDQHDGQLGQAADVAGIALLGAGFISEVTWKLKAHVLVHFVALQVGGACAVGLPKALQGLLKELA